MFASIRNREQIIRVDLGGGTFMERFWEERLHTGAGSLERNGLWGRGGGP